MLGRVFAVIYIIQGVGNSRQAADIWVALEIREAAFKIK